MNKKILVLAVAALLMVGCAQRGTSSITSESSSGSGSSSESSSEGQSSSGESSSGGESSSEDSSSESSSSEEEPPEESPTDLGVMTIAQAKSWLEANEDSISVNSFGNGVDKSKTITIKGYVIGKFDTKKTTKNFGLDVTYCGRVVLGDANSYIAVQSVNGSDGTCLYGKVQTDFVNQSTSKYEVTGYPAVALGHLELQVPSNKTYFTWDENMELTKDISSYIDETVELSQFFNKVKDTQYNCAGHGYDKIYKINGLTCYSFDASSNVYTFTDGARLVKVLKRNISATVGSKYNVIGLATTENYGPALQAISFESIEGAGAELDLSGAITQGSAALVANKTSKEDTTQRFDNYVTSFGNIYKAEVYINAETHSSKLYYGFSDANLGTSFINGADLACSKGFVYFDNKNLWNTTESKANNFFPFTTNAKTDTKVTVYYVPWSINEYKTYNKVSYPLYKVMLLSAVVPAV